MVVGCKDIDFTELKRACRNEETLLRFTLDLVPTPIQHIPAIINNQKYFVALQVRTIQSLTWQKRKDLCEFLLRDASVKGVPDVIYDYKDILMAIDCGVFSRYLEEEEHRYAEG